MSIQSDLDDDFIEVANKIKGRTAPAGLNTPGLGRTVYIAHDAVVPVLPPYTQIIRLPEE